MRKISANKTYIQELGLLENQVIIVDENGMIRAIDDLSNHDKTSVEILEGILIPGLINCHCHLELSHMKAKVDTGTGLIDFIKGVVTKRNMPMEEIWSAITLAEEEMIQNGIVAVGDISNVIDSFPQKSKGNLRYYTFVEFFDFLQNQNATAEFEKYYAVYQNLICNSSSSKSCVPHAPYSVSPLLFKLINQANEAVKKTISIHNQETVPENELFLTGKGDFVDFYSQFGISLSDFKASGQTSIHYALEHLDPKHRTLFVHNTLSSQEDIAFAQSKIQECFWATCPNANLYIENGLPNYKNFIQAKAKVCIGTDSLTSNWGLSVFSEMQTIKKYQSYVSDLELLQWGTINGAEALGFEKELGGIQVGKSPGLNLIRHSKTEESIFSETATIQKII